MFACPEITQRVVCGCGNIVGVLSSTGIEPRVSAAAADSCLAAENGTLRPAESPPGNANAGAGASGICAHKRIAPSANPVASHLKPQTRMNVPFSGLYLNKT